MTEATLRNLESVLISPNLELIGARFRENGRELIELAREALATRKSEDANG